MTTGQLLMTFTLGGAALALWAYVRWPGAAPATITGAVLRILVALLVLQVASSALDVGAGAAPALAIFIVVVAVVPTLTYAFLASIWFLKVVADQLP